VSEFIISCLYKAQHVSGDTPPIIRGTTALAASGFAYVKSWTLWLLDGCWTLTASGNHNVQQPSTYAKPEAASAVLLMMGGVSPETC